ncbi:GDSL esterase/lipase EXL3-like [Tripterygium wilfordii]|uniref:GDSL esterase/lipase EXL3-like n=1 Tax=Tripterygium wilfordii TaxID=458696 RepID=A0A7J7D3F1_TRIWF|nr:GDSL esterase/lipase EXL3-like [Tripterygium wilfordii]
MSAAAGSSVLLLFIIVSTSVYVNVVYMAAGGASVNIPANETVPAVIAFGDSIVDSGNNNFLETVIKCNFPPYGKDFKGGLPTGRFCDGRVPSDLIAEELGIKETVPAYLDPTLKPQDLITGVSFASGGSGYDPLTPKLVSVISLSDQIGYFKDYIMKLKMSVGEERTNFILSKSIFVVVAGSDDIANTYFALRVRKIQYDVPAYTDLIANSASTFIKELYELGARRMAVFSAPPIGCVPSQRTLGGGIQRECAEDPNKAALLFNSKLSAQLDNLATSLPNSRIVYIDIYNPLLDLIKNPTQHVEELGIKELLPAYQDPNLQPKDLLTGVNFASGGAGFDPLTSQIAMCYSLEDQLNQFKEYRGKVTGLIGEAGASNLVALSLVLVVASSNDIATTYFDSRIRQAHYDIGTYTDIVVRSASDYVKELYGVGARRIGLFGAPPLGCIPSSRTVAGGIQRECNDTYNQASQLLNSKLAAELSILNDDLPGATVVYIDIYNPIQDIIDNPGKYGFNIVNKGCCGTGLIEASVFCNQFSPHTCPDDSGYLFWDGFHPTEKAYKILTTEIIKNSVNQFLCGDTPC